MQSEGWWKLMAEKLRDKIILLIRIACTCRHLHCKTKMPVERNELRSGRLRAKVWQRERKEEVNRKVKEQLHGGRTDNKGSEEETERKAERKVVREGWQSAHERKRVEKGLVSPLTSLTKSKLWISKLNSNKTAMRPKRFSQPLTSTKPKAIWGPSDTKQNSGSALHYLIKTAICFGNLC